MTTRLPCRPPKRLRRSTLETSGYTEHSGETDTLPEIAIVHRSHDSSDVDPNQWRSDETQSDTEPDKEETEIPDYDEVSGTCRHSRTAERRQPESRV